VPDPDAEPLAHLLLESPGRAGDDVGTTAVDDEDGDRVDGHHVLHSIQQFLKEVLRPELGEVGIGDRLEAPELIGQLGLEVHGLTLVPQSDQCFCVRSIEG